MTHAITPQVIRREMSTIRRRILERDGYQCVICGASRPLAVHHIVAVVDGGGNDPTNLATLCRKHHTLMHRWKMRPDEMRALAAQLVFALDMPRTPPPEPDDEDDWIQQMFDAHSSHHGFFGRQAPM